MIPYTYLIGWSKLDKWYYGVRYAKGCNPNDLWVKYFTSSNNVKKFRKANGEPDVIQIRRIFDNKSKALLWEHKVLKRMKVLKNNQLWLNKSIPHEKLTHKLADENFVVWNNGLPAWNRGIPITETQRQKQKTAMKNRYVGEKNPFFGRVHSEISNEKNRKSHTGVKQSKETCNKKRLCALNKRHTEKSKEKMSLLKFQWHKERKEQNIPHWKQRKAAA